jgi:hypothetical protein
MHFKLNHLAQFTLLISLATNASAWTGPTGMTFLTKQEFQATIADGFQVSEPWNSVWHKDNSTYFVWVDTKYRAWVTQIINGTTVKTIPIDTGTDYLVQPDGHHRFSVGVDAAGYIHVTGDMHNYMDGTTGVINPYPTRYQKQTILYWKSNLPNDVTGGFTFAGGLNAPTTIPGGGWMMGRFFADNNGVLYYSSSVHAYESSTNVGQQAVGLYVYNTSTKSWKALGGIADNGGQPYTSHLFPVFYWELAGQAPSGWFQNYEPSFKFDKNNRMHFTENGANRLIYAFSDDGGQSWKRANGSMIPTLPIRGADTQPSVGDIALDIGTGTNYLGAQIGLITDKKGMIATSVNNGNNAFAVWYSWNGTAWNTSNAENIPTLPTPSFGYRLKNNNLVFDIPSVKKILFSDSLQSPLYGYDFTNYASYNNIDEYSALHNDVVYGIGVNANVETVLATSIVPASLPTGWKCADITNSASLYSGTCGYVNNTFVTTNYENGVNWAGTTDNYYFVYQKITGDTTIISQVNSAGNIGVMMRNSLSPTDVNAAIIVNNNTVGMNSRSGKGYRSTGYKSFKAAAVNWVKLVRSGTTITGYYSADGVTWTTYQTLTLPLAKTMYVGLVSSSGQSGWFMQNATFSNVSIK